MGIVSRESGRRETEASIDIKKKNKTKNHQNDKTTFALKLKNSK